MSTLFDPHDHIISVTVRLTGPLGEYYARLALDTGASYTIVRNSLLTRIGYEPNTMPKTMTFTTGSGVESAARVTVDRFEALGEERSNFPVIA